MCDLSTVRQLVVVCCALRISEKWWDVIILRQYEFSVIFFRHISFPE